MNPSTDPIANAGSQKVSDLMSRCTVTVTSKTELTAAIVMMNQGALSCIPVVDEKNQLCGVLSTFDLIPLSYSLNCDIAVLQIVSDGVRRTLTDALAKDNHQRTVEDCMTRSVITTTPGVTIREASQSLIDHCIHHLPVVDNEHQVIGMLSTSDIIRAIAYA